MARGPHCGLARGPHCGLARGPHCGLARGPPELIAHRTPVSLDCGLRRRCARRWFTQAGSVCVEGLPAGLRRSGTIGRRLVPALVAAGHQVRDMTRFDAAAQTAAAAGAEPVCGDVTDPASLSAAVHGCQVVIHAAGRMGASPAIEPFWPVNVTGTRNMLAAAADAQVRRFIYLGAAMSLLGSPRPITGADESRATATTTLLRIRGVQDTRRPSRPSRQRPPDGHRGDPARLGVGHPRRPVNRQLRAGSARRPHAPDRRRPAPHRRHPHRQPHPRHRPRHRSRRQRPRLLRLRRRQHHRPGLPRRAPPGARPDPAPGLHPRTGRGRPGPGPRHWVAHHQAPGRPAHYQNDRRTEPAS